MSFQTLVFKNLYITKLCNKYGKLRIYKRFLKKEYITNPNNYVLYQIMTLQKQMDSLSRKILNSKREYTKTQKQTITK
jgi:hypothetical protein